MQALPLASLLLLEQVGGQPDQEVRLRGPRQISHAAAEGRDPGEDLAAQNQGPVR